MNEIYELSNAEEVKKVAKLHSVGCFHFALSSVFRVPIEVSRDVVRSVTGKSRKGTRIGDIDECIDKLSKMKGKKWDKKSAKDEYVHDINSFKWQYLRKGNNMIVVTTTHAVAFVDGVIYNSGLKDNLHRFKKSKILFWYTIKEADPSA